MTTIRRNAIWRELGGRLNSTAHLSIRHLCSSQCLYHQLKTSQDIDKFLAKPSWSVKSLLPTAEQLDESKDVTPQQLRHLLRLSALPEPSTAEEESQMLRDLQAQLHFVKKIQEVDITGVEPLRSLRDETAAADEENTVTLQSLEEDLGKERVVGKYHKRIRRSEDTSHTPESNEAEEWDVLGQAPSKAGRYFIVESGEKGNG